jgi:hypothetical protein
VVEPACGIGHFIGLMPEEMLRRSTVTGIEIDPLTAHIAKALYPDADIREQPFEKSKLADESFDLAISNVPFGDYPVHDPRWNKYKFPIHDYFFPAALGQGATGRTAHVHHVTSHDGQARFIHARDCSRPRRNCSAQSGCPTTPSRKMPERKSPPTFVMLRKLRAGEKPCGRGVERHRFNYTNEHEGKFCAQ